MEKQVLSQRHCYDHSVQLDGQGVHSVNGGPHFKFTEAISLVVHCQTQQRVDHFWEKLSEGGQQVECGWLKDKFGLSWQIVPDVLLELLESGDSQQSERVMKAMLKMKKLDIEGLKRAAGRRVVLREARAAKFSQQINADHADQNGDQEAPYYRFALCHPR